MRGRIRSRAMTHEHYLATRHFPALDGLRAVSVLMVLAFHAHDPLWEPLRGYLGVTVFFVISGMLITTLLLREEDRDGRIAMRAFLRRRWWRIVPLYVVALAVFTVGAVSGVAGGGEGYGARLAYFLTFTNEFAGLGTFAHSWSLGIEEKFYVVWPLLAFAIAPLARHRTLLVGVLLLVAIGSLALTPRAYPFVYAPVLVGCALALALHSRRSFAQLERLSRGAGPALVLALIVVTLTAFGPAGYVPLINVPFAIAVALLFPALLASAGPVHRVFAARGLTYVGRRSYAIYLFHLLCVDAVTRFLPAGASAPVQIARIALIAGASIVVAELLHRTVEAPLIAFGRRERARPGDTRLRARWRAARA